MSSLPQPPPDIEVPREIPGFFRIGPGMLILGTLCVMPCVSALAEALRYRDIEEGFRMAAFYAMFSIPLWFFFLLLQGLLGICFMRHGKRAWWRSLLVLSPAIALLIPICMSVISLYPHERRARRELKLLAGGEIPASVSAVSLDYHGGRDPTYNFEFTIDPNDYETLKGYREYRAGKGWMGMSANALVTELGAGPLYYLDYDPLTGRGKFSVVYH